LLPVLLGAALLALGCASTTNVNPAAPKMNTGYVDFYADDSGEFSWDIQRLDATSSTKIYYDVDPLKSKVLRLAMPPGQYRLRVTFLNYVITEPALFDLVVQDGHITPVHVSLTEAGVSSVRTKETSRGGTAYGRHGRRTSIDSYESKAYRVSATPQPPAPYRPKEQMPYAKSTAN
jgi:hypothetical protein